MNDRGARRWAVVAIMLSWLVTIAVNAPGQMSYDSVVQLNEGRNFAFRGFHPPLMSFLLGIFDWIFPGTALYLLFVSAFFFLSPLMVIWRAKRVTWLTVIVIALVAASPMTVLYQGIVWKDILFANLAVFAFFLLLGVQRHDRAVRYGIYLASLAAAGAATQVRQNGFVIMPFIGIALVHLETLEWTGWRAWAGKLAGGVMIGIIGFIVASVACTTTIRAVAVKAPENSLVQGIRAIENYDIVEMVAHGADLSALAADGLDIAAVRADASRYYTPQRATPFEDELPKPEMPGKRPDAGPEVNKLVAAQMLSAWLKMIVDNPLIYLRHRLEVVRWLVWPPDIDVCQPAYAGRAGPDDLVKELDLQVGVFPPHEELYAYGLMFADTVVFRQGFYLIVAVAIIAVLLVRRTRDSTPVVCLLAAAWAFAFSWFFAAISCDFRYLYFIAVAVGLSLVMISVVAGEAAVKRG